MKKRIVIFLMSVLLIGLLAACGTKENDSNNGAGENADDKKVLIMGTSADYPPFEYVDTSKSEEIVGFDVDLAKAIAEKAGYKVQVKDIDFSGLIPAIETEQVDFVMAGMTPTEDRKKNVNFSDIYYVAKNMIVTKKDSSIKSVDDLKDKTIGVQLSSIQEGEAKELAKTMDIKVENRNRIPELVQELKAGRFDAAMIEDTVAKGYFKKNPDLAGFTMEVSEQEAGSAIAFPKDSKLTEDFNKALNEMKENGELEKLVVKWFGGE
jgi:arginine/lysine/histidine transporter system substrate-binding protein